MWKKIKEHIDKGSLLIAGITLVLFIAALFVKGMTHDILLETGVFLVSVKLIIATYKLSLLTRKIEKKIDDQTDILISLSKDKK